MEGSKNYMIPTEPQMASHYPQKVVIVWVRDKVEFQGHSH